MIEYVVLGTSHKIQDSPQFEQPLTNAIRKHMISLVAEEYPFPSIPSSVHRTAMRLDTRYLQIDPLPQEYRALGIYEEMQIRTNSQYLQGKDVRLSHADSVREQFSLDKIEGNIERGRVLIVCGYLHADFLAEHVRDRGGKILEKISFPAELLNRKPEQIFTPIELQKY